MRGGTRERRDAEEHSGDDADETVRGEAAKSRDAVGEIAAEVGA